MDVDFVNPLTPSVADVLKYKTYRMQLKHLKCLHGMAYVYNRNSANNVQSNQLITKPAVQSNQACKVDNSYFSVHVYSTINSSIKTLTTSQKSQLFKYVMIFYEQFGWELSGLVDDDSYESNKPYQNDEYYQHLIKLFTADPESLTDFVDGYATIKDNAQVNSWDIKLKNNKIANLLFIKSNNELLCPEEINECKGDVSPKHIPAVRRTAIYLDMLSKEKYDMAELTMCISAGLEPVSFIQNLIGINNTCKKLTLNQEKKIANFINNKLPSLNLRAYLQCMSTLSTNKSILAFESKQFAVHGKSSTKSVTDTNLYLDDIFIKYSHWSNKGTLSYEVNSISISSSTFIARLDCEDNSLQIAIKLSVHECSKLQKLYSQHPSVKLTIT